MFILIFFFFLTFYFVCSWWRQLLCSETSRLAFSKCYFLRDLVSFLIGECVCLLFIVRRFSFQLKVAVFKTWPLIADLIGENKLLAVTQ